MTTVFLQIAIALWLSALSLALPTYDANNITWAAKNGSVNPDTLPLFKRAGSSNNCGAWKRFDLAERVETKCSTGIAGTPFCTPNCSTKIAAWQGFQCSSPDTDYGAGQGTPDVYSCQFGGKLPDYFAVNNWRGWQRIDLYKGDGRWRMYESGHGWKGVIGECWPDSAIKRCGSNVFYGKAQCWLGDNWNCK